ncbi:delta-1-pyrroline-5-carboxylate dehydrogenase [Seinonella peptonophila]|uniref:L-glutamate gamma-semialdehyde dehydrogenase n=1 Tax=Seinonella peptonophila TaxID=112248 RepID=A0A1M4SKU3_9BACL|nr:L-glutamate gamma-semialdehyde dehydrogenase [Seinonella peptonophila]SHE32826.1 delta-1-pyrroline-5-carboxylate dehydrogenase [Seinonella peptonophila]
MLTPFVNEPFTNFQDENNRKAMKLALTKVKNSFGHTYPLYIGSEKIYTKTTTPSINPGKVSETIGYMSSANRELAEKAMQKALDTFETWKKVSPEERASYLFKAANLMRERKHEFSSLLVFEAGKNWAEADADTAEAIDFLEFYAREMIRLDRINETLPPTQIPTEKSQLRYIPLGVGIVIPPWNFPLAICVGMTSAAIVSGNTVLLKPASPTSIIAYQFVSLMKEVGLPPGVINFIPGNPNEIGDFLTAHPKTRFISFTGSKQVGLHINKLAANTAKNQIWIKRVIAEMGGKDGIIVDETADLDQAAQQIVASAFGFQGQKCSAGSRAILVDSIYDQVVSKILDLTKTFTIGLPEENHPIGPVIDQKAYDKILSYIEIGKQEGSLLLGGSTASGDGFYIQPTIFGEVDQEARIMQEEIFGPVLAITRATDWQEAIQIYNHTEYGLTGSFFSKDEHRIQQAQEQMHCGNLYINRKCTGALVGVHPFGGFNMSGTDSKAGGYDYLLLFTQAKSISRQIS